MVCKVVFVPLTKSSLCSHVEGSKYKSASIVKMVILEEHDDTSNEQEHCSSPTVTSG